MSANYTRISSFPSWTPLTPSVRELLENYINRLDAEPKELQRGKVLTTEWAQGIIASILLGVKIQGFTWTLQETNYKKIGLNGYEIDVEYKNTDGYQRISAIVMFYNNEITIPGDKPEDFTIPWKNRDYEIGGMSFSEVEKSYPGLMDAKFLSVGLRVDVYGVEGHWCSRQQETYLFKYVANNQNEMNGQQWRNPTCSQIAEDIRDDARLEPVPSFKHNLFKFGNSKMDYDEVAAIINHFIVYGSTKGINKKSLNDFYEHPDLESGKKIYSLEFRRNINLRGMAKYYYTFLYNILKDKDKKPVMKKTRCYSLLWYAHIHLRTGFQNLFNYDKLREQFHRLHNELCEKLPGGEDSVYTRCLISNTSENISKALELWEEKLNITKELKYVIFRDPKRGFTIQEIDQALHKQGGVCAADGKPLLLKDAIGGHNIAWSKGGPTKLDNCIAIRKEHNDAMGTQTLDEYISTKDADSESALITDFTYN